MPERVQRKRTKGWKMPKGTVYVGRPGRFGNPFKIVGDMIYGDASHRRTILNPWVHIEPTRNDFVDWTLPLQDVVVILYINWLAGNDKNNIIPPPTKNDLEILRGKKLACWCRLDQKCHADVLLELANK